MAAQPRPAAPEPVAALDDIVHFRYGPGQKQRTDFLLPLQYAGDHDEIFLRLPDHIGPVQPIRARKGHTVVLPEAKANARIA